MPLNKKQQEAVEYLDGPLLVLAGPGTGKTQLLSKKVEYILQNTDTDPSMILCITYTEAGAENMKERLRNMIGQAADKIDIMTFHAFGQKILGLYSQFATEPQRSFTEPIEEIIQLKIIEELQANLPNPYLLKDKQQQKNLLSLIAKIKVSKVSPEELRTIVKQNQQDIEILNKELAPILQDLPDKASGKNAYTKLTETVYIPLLKKLGELKTDQPIVGRIYSLFDVFYEKIYSLIEEQASSEKPSVKNINSFIKKYFSKDNNGIYKFSELASNQRLLELAELYEKYQNYLQEHGYFDFNDMIEMPIKYLEDDIDFRRKIAQNYLYIMVDEYQDTNPSQTRLLELIADEQESPSVMAVGDDDQSIFEFQGAKASSLIYFKNHFNAKVIVLTENYRSTSEILHFSRKIADQLDESFIKNETMQRSLHAENQVTEDLKKELTSVRNLDILKNTPEDFLFEQISYSATGNKNTDSNQSSQLNKSITQKTFIERHQFINQDAEYNWIAERVHQLIQAGTDPSDIGILFPKHKCTTALIPYLRKYPEINLAYERTENILENEQIYELLTLCNFIYQLSEGENPSFMLPEILSFDFWDIPSEDMILAVQSIHRHKRQALEILQTYLDNPYFADLAAFFAELAKLSLTLPLEFLLDMISGFSPVEITVNQQIKTFTSPFLTFYSKDSYSKNTFDFYNRLRLLRNRLLSRTKKNKLRLTDLIQLVDDYKKTETSITEQTFYRDSDKAVNLMTAHKSKGLEFKHVFLINLTASAWDGSGGPNTLTLPLNLETISDARNTPDGKKRLLFVAITRAAKTLTMTNPKYADDSEKENKPLSFLDEKFIQTDGKSYISSPFIPAGRVIEHNEILSDDEKASAIRRIWLNKLLDPSEKIESLLKERVKDFRLSASHISSFIRLTYGGPLNFYLNSIIKAPSEPTSLSIAYGNLIHKVFEEITKNQLTKEEAILLYMTEAKKQDLLEEDIKTLIERGEDEPPLAIDEYQSILQNPGAKAEVDFSSEHLFFEGIPITGKIDHLNIDEQNKLIDIYDFKTSTISDRDKWHSKESLYIYHFQLLFYRLLLKQSKFYHDYTVRSMNLLFTTPNRRETLDHPNGKFHKLTLTEEDIAKDDLDFEDLIKAIYHQITTLDFLRSDSPLNLANTADATLADIKKFCHQLIDLYKNS
jgi:ATP-dependent exoDNAse (exonuclease V) beta subunit (contains helicase and exonuclease domains)